MGTLVQDIGGAVGKGLTDVGTWANAPRLGQYLGQPGGALGASLQNWGGQATQSPFQWVTPAYTSETAPINNNGAYSTYNPYAGAQSNPYAGAQSNPNPNPNPNPTTTSSGGSLHDQFNSALSAGAYKGWDPNAAWADFQAKGGNLGFLQNSGINYDQIRNEIGSGFDQYIQGLQNQSVNCLPTKSWLNY